MKTDVSQVLWTGEMRVTLDGADVWPVVGSLMDAEVRHQQGDAAVILWAAISNDELVGPFLVADGLKMNFQGYMEISGRPFCLNNGTRRSQQHPERP